jgi:hypothetical protein
MGRAVPVQKFVSLVCYAIGIFLLQIFFIWDRTVSANEWRLLDPLTHGSTSKCIGDPKTPLCAAETYAACFLAGRKELCRSVGVDYDAEFGDFHPRALTRLYLLFYFKVDQATLGVADIPAKYPKFGGRSWQPGDIALRMAWQTCEPDLQCLENNRDSPVPTSDLSCRTLKNCRQFPPFDVFNIVRKTGAHWSLIGDYRREDLPQFFEQR